MTSTKLQELIWTGSYTADGGGHGAGIGAVSASPDGRLTRLGTAVEALSPSFVTAHPELPVVYAVCEHAQEVQAYNRSGEWGLEPLGSPWQAGKAVCHVAVDPRGRFLVAACWGDGQVLLYELSRDGRIVSRFAVEPAEDPHGLIGERQSRAHASLVLKDGRVMTTDLGHDLLRVWNYIPGEGLIVDHVVALPKGSGPRHLVEHASGSVFVVTEYSIEVAVVRQNSGSGIYSLTDLGPATVTGASPGDSAAEIALAPDGARAYVGIRGSNRISVLTIEADGSALHPISDSSSHGDWPRHHLVRASWLHVAHERSGDVITFPLDSVTGLLGEPIDRLEIGSPTALVLNKA